MRIRSWSQFWHMTGFYTRITHRFPAIISVSMNRLSTQILAAFTGCFLFAVTPLSATTIVLGESELLGTVKPATPASAANATEQVRYLVHFYNLNTPDGTNLGDNPADKKTETYFLYRPDAAPAELALPEHAGKVNTSNPLVDLGGMTYQYILFFQANSAYIYYIGNISGFDSVKWGGDPFSNDSNVDGSTISHYSLFNGSPTLVPDESTTLLLLGFGLVLLRIVGRHRQVG